MFPLCIVRDIEIGKVRKRPGVHRGGLEPFDSLRWERTVTSTTDLSRKTCAVDVTMILAHGLDGASTKAKPARATAFTRTLRTRWRI